MADIVVAAFSAGLALVGDLVHEIGVDTVRGVERGIWILGELITGHGVRGIEIHVAGGQRQGGKPDYKYLLHSAISIRN